MSQTPNAILERMLDRLFGAISSGPSMNCRPHNSRQRVDLTTLGRLGDAPPAGVLASILGPDAAAKLCARVPPPPARAARSAAGESGEQVAAAESPEMTAARQAWSDQAALLSKLRVLAEEARTYLDDTGVHVLNIGFPLLSLPPGSGGGRAAGADAGWTRRILAPLAFIPVELTIKSGVTPTVKIACRHDEVDRVVPNEALLAWLEQQTGAELPDLYRDEEGTDPWRELRGIARHVAAALGGLALPDTLTAESLPGSITLEAAPRSDDEDPKPRVVLGAVLGLFPASNQGLLRDTQALLAGEPAPGPVQSFLRADVRLDAPPEGTPSPESAAPAKRTRTFTDERLVAAADPCQARAVAHARASTGLVVHGPPGTGKSQTITNIIGDHLARGERVLFVCDKRTALDVVADRLDHLGLGSLCAVVHDPRRDQRDLYMSIRDQLEALADVKTSASAERELAKTDAELERLHTELTGYWRSLMTAASPEAPTLHELVGRWLDAATRSAAAGASPAVDAGSLGSVTPEALESHALDIRDALARGLEAAYATNPWVAAVAGQGGITLESLLARPVEPLRAALAGAARAAHEADATLDPAVPPFVPGVDLAEQAEARADLGARIEAAVAETPAALRALWAGRDRAAVAAARRALAEIEPQRAAAGAALDPELAAVARAAPPTPAELAGQLGALEAYLPIARAWWGFLAFGKKAAAGKVLSRYGLPTDAASAERLRAFLRSVRGALALREVVARFTNAAPGAGLPDPVETLAAAGHHARVLDALARAHEDPALAALTGPAGAALAADPAGARVFTDALRRSGPRAGALQKLESALAGVGLFSAPWLESFRAAVRGGEPAAGMVAALHDRLPLLDEVLRAQHAAATLPPALGAALRTLLGASVSPEHGLDLLERDVLAADVARRLEADPALRALDARRVQTVFDRYAALEERKRALVRDAVLHRWVSLQKERLLVSTGSRLNSGAAELKRRLTVRGKHAMRLRQVVAQGARAEGGDPLLDLRPVWMASPETVAQVFPRAPVFDTVVFDEASQCRLEEALPVLTRARRVVIAGDPKQLPPTRFFETAVARSEAEEPETDQGLFEAQQSEVEDLLGAALNLEIQRSYLDVHYRSRNADLIAFSNANFYSSRLQPIPAHPSNTARFAPITLHRVDGVYRKRENEKEAEAVVRIIRDLLKRAEPPSIGVGCFNIAQRDLIAEKLDEAAAEDAGFAQRLASARERRGRGSQEGLFVKNLENVQGDERDHVIISTTYGPDETGRFYRRFGPLAMPGGGRRLNVLVTRARQEVHLVTSIPREAYLALPPVPDGQTAGGGWLLMAYLKFAEDLAALYERAHETGEAATADPATVRVDVAETRAPSTLARALAERLATEARLGSTVHWGNDGFGIDVALRHPSRPDGVTAGVLCDFSRFGLAADPVEWDVFRTRVLESQGWPLHRLLSPTLFRDPRGAVEAIAARARKVAEETRDEGAIRVRG